MSSTVKNANRCLAAALLVASLLVAGCSEEVSTGNGSGGATGETSESTPEATSSPPSTMPETTMDTGTLEGGIGEEPGVVLRVEGDSGVTFSGLCDVGDEEAVLGGGQVPQRYEFDPRGERLSCKIQKLDSGDGDLKVTLLVGDSTRSVQQINTPESAINVSYEGG